MQRITVERTQHAIGQGGFHTAILRAGGRRFSVVYDCGGGTAERRSRIIDSIVDAYPLAHDWLVISHLDEDHINGIARLEEKGIRFANVFLPHVDLAHSVFMMLLKIVGESAGAIADERLESVRIAGRLYSGAYGRPIIIARNRNVPGNDAVRSSDNLKDLAPHDLPPPSGFFLTPAWQEALAPARRGAILSDARSIHLHRLDWTFRFYSQEWATPQVVADLWNLPVLAGLRHAIDDLAQLGTRAGRTFTDGIQAALETPVSQADANAALRASHAGHATVRKRITVNALLKLLYKELPALHDYNSSSLCLYSGPAGIGGGPRQWYQRRTSLTQHEAGHRYLTRAVGWLGMGDAHLGKPADLAAFVEHYGGELRLTSTLMLPHHGSRLNYDDERITLHGLLDTLPASPDLTLIAASNPDHQKYRHPHRQVVDIAARYGKVHNVNLDWRSMFEESVVSQG